MATTLSQINTQIQASMARTSSEDQTSVLYPTLLNDNDYFTLFRFLERCNNFMTSSTGTLHRSMSESIDGISLRIGKSEAEIELYESGVLRYRRVQYRGSTHIYPGMIRLNKDSANIDMNPTTLITNNRDLKKELEDVYILLNGSHYTNDISAELFQYSTMYSVLSEEEIREIVNRLYNLPLLPNYELTLYNNLGMMDRESLVDFDELLKGY